MVSTTKFNTLSVGVPQHGTYWCIPASIENLFRADSINDISQEDLLYEYLLTLNIIGKSDSGAPLPLNSLERHIVLETFRCQPIPKISFQAFIPIANTILAREGKPIRLADINPIPTQKEYVTHLNDLLSKDKPVLISAAHAKGAHITVVYQIDSTTLWSYDPGRDKHLEELISNYEFSYDLLYIQ